MDQERESESVEQPQLLSAGVGNTPPSCRQTGIHRQQAAFRDGAENRQVNQDRGKKNRLETSLRTSAR